MSKKKNYITYAIEAILKVVSRDMKENLHDDHKEHSRFVILKGDLEQALENFKARRVR